MAAPTFPARRELELLEQLAEITPSIELDCLTPEGRPGRLDLRRALRTTVAELRAELELEAPGAPWWGLDPTTRELFADVVDDPGLDGPLLDTHDLGDLADRFDAARRVVMDGPRVGRIHREQLAALLLFTATALQRAEDTRAALAEIRGVAELMAPAGGGR